MKQITFNPSNEPYYSDDFIKGFKCGAKRQFEADKKARPKGEWIDKGWKGDWQFETDGRGNCWREYECSNCNCPARYITPLCPQCGARMKGADHEID